MRKRNSYISCSSEKLKKSPAAVGVKLNQLGIEFQMHDKLTYVIEYDRIKKFSPSELPEGLIFYPLNADSRPISINGCGVLVYVFSGQFIIEVEERKESENLNSYLSLRQYYEVKQEAVESLCDFPVITEVWDETEDSILLSYDYHIEDAPSLEAAVWWLKVFLKTIEDKLPAFEMKVKSRAGKSLKRQVSARSFKSKKRLQ